MSWEDIASMKWQDWSALATCVGAGIAVGAAFFVIWQICEARKQRRLEALSKLWDSWEVRDVRDARAYVLSVLGEMEKADRKNGTKHLERKLKELVATKMEATGINDNERTPWHEKRDVELVLASCNRVAFLVLRKHVSENDAICFMGGSMIRIWEILEDYVKERQKEYKVRYMCHFQKFVDRYRCKMDEARNDPQKRPGVCSFCECG